jgi:hypothetical protein
MSRHNITITFTEQYGLTLQSPRDYFMMNLTQLQCFTEEEQLDINLVRI